MQVHYLPDVRDVKTRAGLCPYVLLQIRRGDAATGYVCSDGVHDASRNSSGLATTGKILDAFKVSFVVTAQPVANPCGATHHDATVSSTDMLSTRTMWTATILALTL